MALVLANRVQETSTTTGTGTLTLAGAVLGYQTFSAGIGVGNTCYYAITSTTGDWEVGIGTVGTGTLARTTLLSSSTGSLVSFTGTLNVYVTYPSEKSVNLDAANVMTGYSISGGSINGTTIGSTTAAAGSFTTLNSSGATRLGGLSGNQSLQVNNVASAVNYAQIVGGITTGAPVLSVQGTDTNISLVYDAKGSGAHFFRSASGATQFQIASMASAVNYMGTFGGSTGNYPTLSATGSDANVGFVFNSKGTAFQAFQTNSITQAIITHTASAVNYAQITGAATGAAPTLSAQGSDANINLDVTAKGVNGAINLKPNGALTVIAGQSGSGVGNHVVLYPTSNTFNWVLRGTDTNVGFALTTKGTGNFFFNTGGGTQAFISDAVSAVNYLAFVGAATGAAPTISAAGSDANPSLVLNGKGTGVVALGGSTVANSAAQFVPSTSGVNFLQFTGGATGVSPSFVSSGTDAAVGFNISTKGNANVAFFTNNFGNFSFIIKNVASAVNYIQATGAGTLGAPELSAQGSDANINLKLTAKGTGGVQFTGPLLPNNLAGTSGQVLTSAGAGAVPTWAAPVSSNITANGLFENNATISANYTIGTGNNAVSAGPITINSGVVVTVPSGSTWVVV